MKQIKSSKAALFSLIFTIFTDFLGFSLVITIFAPIILDKSSLLLATGISPFSRNFILGCLLAIFPLAQFFGAPLFNNLANRRGRRNVLLITIVGSFISYILAGIALCLDQIVLLFIARLIAGFFAGNVLVAQGGIGDISEHKTRVSNFAWIATAGSVAYIIGPILAGRLSNPQLVDWFNIATPFWIVAIVFVINFFLIFFTIKENNSNRATTSTNHLSVWEGFKNLGRLGSIPGMRPLFWTFFLARIGFWGFLLFFGAYLVEQFQFNRTSVSDAYMYLAIWMFILLPTVIVWLGKTFSTRKLVAPVLLLLGIAIIAIARIEHYDLIYWIIPFWALAAGGFYTYMMTLMASKVEQESRNQAFGILQTLQSTAQIIAPLVAGILITGHIVLPFLLSGIIIIIAAIIYVFCVRTAP